MRPPFTNPHLLPRQYEIVSRAGLYPEDGTLEKVENYDENKLKMLQQLISRTMPPLTQCDDSPEAYSSTSEEKLLFRLISTSMQPMPIFLHPRPPPPSVTREPDTEDTHEQALTRRQCAEAVAIDGSTILRESRITEGRRRLYRSIAISHAEISTPVPPLLLITTKQQPRKTRPPVLASELAYYPYNTTSAINPRAQPNVKICPTLEADVKPLDTTKSSRRQRRKRLNVSKQDRPLPKFWRPGATWLGPCKGYAYGYP